MHLPLPQSTHLFGDTDLGLWKYDCPASALDSAGHMIAIIIAPSEWSSRRVMSPVFTLVRALSLCIAFITAAPGCAPLSRRYTSSFSSKDFNLFSRMQRRLQLELCDPERRENRTWQLPMSMVKVGHDQTDDRALFGLGNPSGSE